MFIDYNLYGMNMINVCAVKFRKQKTDECESCYLPYKSYDRMQKKKESEESSPWTPTSLFDRTEMVTPSRKTWDISNIQEELLLDESITRQSTCELECDVVAPDILNRQDVDDKIGINPGLAALWEDEKQRKRNMGEPSQITPPDSQERENLEISESDQMLRLKFLQIIQDQKPYM
ncbi:REV3L [Mytilus coruscus]|uniref:REV3L n=1 Tax=Mytilus coruscus TaxID=42192 RepID=A0A6J8BC39_MYTCO|nr:REV3L [Mytilus coruscus]